MTFTIDKGVPLPEKGLRFKYPFDQMEVGDSFFVAGKDTSQMSALCKRAGTRLNSRFVTAKATTTMGSGKDAAEVTGVRVWRAE